MRFSRFLSGRTWGVMGGVASVAFAGVAVCQAKGTQALSWGSSQYYQTGLGHDHNVPSPTVLDALDNKNITAIACGGQSCAALSESGELLTWGRGSDGRLGHGSTQNESFPRVVEELLGEKVVSVHCGDSHMACVTDKGELWTWGKHVHKQLGHSERNFPRPVEALSGVKIKQAACGRGHTLALTEQGDVYSWGLGREGALGTGKKDTEATPVKLDREVFGGEEIVQIVAGDDYSAFLTGSGQVFTCGASDFGQVGHGAGERYVRTPKQVRAFQRQPVTEIAAGPFHMVALTQEGRVFAWGFNKAGGLGMGDTFNKSTPHHISQLDSVSVAHVYAGGEHSAFLADDRQTVFMCGSGQYGQIGMGSESQMASVAAYRTSPVELHFFQKHDYKITHMALGSDHSMALTESVL